MIERLGHVIGVFCLRDPRDRDRPPPSQHRCAPHSWPTICRPPAPPAAASGYTRNPRGVIFAVPEGRSAGTSGIQRARCARRRFSFLGGGDSTPRFPDTRGCVNSGPSRRVFRAPSGLPPRPVHPKVRYRLFGAPNGAPRRCHLARPCLRRTRRSGALVLHVVTTGDWTGSECASTPRALSS